jgi:predicted RNase H-like HicB family nuclease
MNDFSKYAVFVVWSEEDNAFISTVPELPGCLSDGSTPEEAIANLRVIAQEWIETAQAEGRAVPQPMDTAQMGAAAEAARQAFQNQVQQAVQEAVSRALQMIEKTRSAEGSLQQFGSRMVFLAEEKV